MILVRYALAPIAGNLKIDPSDLSMRKLGCEKTREPRHGNTHMLKCHVRTSTRSTRNSAS